METINKYLLENLNRFRDFTDAKELLSVWSHNPVVWSWGFNKATMYNGKFLAFNVNGHHHRGKVFIAVNGSDLFDIYLTSARGIVKKVINDVYLEDLTDTIDIEVERIDSYTY